MAERPDNIVDLIRCAEGNAERRLRQFIPRKTRHILLVNGTRNSGALPIEQGVLTAHDPLQLRELRHHARHEIGLRELGGTPRIGEGGAIRITRCHLLDNRRRECHETLRLFVHRAEPPLEHDRL